MRTTPVPVSLAHLTVLAHQCLDCFYAVWDEFKRSKYSEVRSIALRAKTEGLVAHDRMLNSLSPEELQ